MDKAFEIQKQTNASLVSLDRSILSQTDIFWEHQESCLVFLPLIRCFDITVLPTVINKGI